MVAQRKALLAWTGHNLTLSPRLNTKMSLAHWGNTLVSGRGLLALSGQGLIHQITLRTGDEYVVHPGNIIAYSMMQHAPQAYRFKATTFRLQIPNPLTWLPDTRFWRTMRDSAVWRFLRDSAFVVRTWARRTIWGDRVGRRISLLLCLAMLTVIQLFLRFQGPATILVQSRGAALSDALTSRDVNEIADSPAGSVSRALSTQSPAEAGARTIASSAVSPTTMSYASVSRDGAVKFNKETQ